MGSAGGGTPVLEVVSQFSFAPDLPSDLTVPGRLYDALKGDLPEKRTVADSVQLLTADRRVAVQVDSHTLTVRHLRPYPGWDTFLALTGRVLEAYLGIAEPESLADLSLRVLNLIEFPGRDHVEFGEYFTFYPRVGPALPQELSHFVSAIEVWASEGRDLLRLQMSRGQTPHASVLLEIACQPALACSVLLADWKAYMVRAHAAAGSAFDGCITDALRARFGR